jgi:hypothetical protein
VGIEQEIADWAASRPAWQRSALARLSKGRAYDQSEIDTLSAALIAGKHPTGAGLSAADVPGARPAGATVLLRSIRDVTNINALLDGQQLTFGESGLTVVYGDNASGKSGYARLIKSAVGARHQESVHANVFSSAATQPQKADIAFMAGATEGVCNWPQTTNGELRAISFYDEGCGDAYIGGDSELTYRPPALSLLDGLIVVCDQARAALDEHLRTNQLSRQALPAVPQGSPAAALLSGLSARTAAAEIDAVCAVPPDASEQLGQLLREEARLRGSDPTKERERLDHVAGAFEVVSRHVAAVENVLSEAKVAEAVAARKRATDLRAAATIASAATFDAEPLSGVGSETWRALWEAARRFSETEAYPDSAFPVTKEGAHCPLCQQALSADASGRLHRFHSFLEETTAQQAANAERAAERAVGSYRALDTTPTAVATGLVAIQEVDPTLASAATNWLQTAATRRDATLTGLESDAPISPPPLGTSPRSGLEDRVIELRAQAASIDRRQFDASLADIVRRRNDLEGSLAVSRERPSVEAEILRLAEREKIERAKRLTDTTGITRKASELADEHVTSLVRDRFTRESDRLRLERIELRKTGGQKGKFRHRPALLGAKISRPVDEVLSEGEQTALGLAGYFTEAHFDDSRSALVLDDPVTSLDHIRRSHVARRLAQFAKDRQVIVFTHDVTFVGDLRRAADEEQVTVTERGVQRRGDNVPGFCTDQHPWKAKDVPRRLNELEQSLARIKRERQGWNQDEYEKECADWAGKLSETWERAINLEIVHQVVDPGTSEVRPRMFKVLAAITEEDDRQFQQSYGRCSAWARRHDKSPGANYVAPQPEELEAELAFVKAWFDRVRKYKN